MFLRKENVEEPTGYKVLVPYCRDCNSTEIEIIQTCKSCGGHNIASPLIHSVDDYIDNKGVKTETKAVTRHIYKCDLCGSEFDGLKTDSFLSYGDGSFEQCNYNGFADSENVDFINYHLDVDLCQNCKAKLSSFLNLKLDNFISESNIKNLINNYLREKQTKGEEK